MRAVLMYVLFGLSIIWPTSGPVRVLFDYGVQVLPIAVVAFWLFPEKAS